MSRIFPFSCIINVAGRWKIQLRRDAAGFVRIGTHCTVRRHSRHFRSHIWPNANALEIFLWSKSANLVKCLWVLCVKRIFVWRVIRHHYRHGKLVECIIIIISLGKVQKAFWQNMRIEREHRRVWKLSPHRRRSGPIASSCYLMRSSCNYALTSTEREPVLRTTVTLCGIIIHSFRVTLGLVEPPKHHGVGISNF